MNDTLDSKNKFENRICISLIDFLTGFIDFLHFQYHNSTENVFFSINAAEISAPFFPSGSRSWATAMPFFQKNNAFKQEN